MKSCKKEELNSNLSTSLEMALSEILLLLPTPQNPLQKNVANATHPILTNNTKSDWTDRVFQWFSPMVVVLFILVSTQVVQ